ncbi:hypothetical protein HY572_02110 [Candidatus Micrarchaeota archaeon]|nr:hypothetical protein [Candidatus Micrarchaeota archaeon]
MNVDTDGFFVNRLNAQRQRVRRLTSAASLMQRHLDRQKSDWLWLGL